MGDQIVFESKGPNRLIDDLLVTYRDSFGQPVFGKATDKDPPRLWLQSIPPAARTLSETLQQELIAQSKMCKVILVVPEDTTYWACAAISCGAHGMLSTLSLSNMTREEIISLVKDFASGDELHYSLSLVVKALKETLSEKSKQQPSASPRALEVLALIKKRWAPKQIAALLKISINTVRHHCKNIRKIYKVRQIYQAIPLAEANGQALDTYISEEVRKNLPPSPAPGVG